MVGTKTMSNEKAAGGSYVTYPYTEYVSCGNLLAESETATTEANTSRTRSNLFMVLEYHCNINNKVLTHHIIIFSNKRTIRPLKFTACHVELCRATCSISGHT